MKRNLAGLFALLALPLALPVAAQDATILNARVVIANGVVFENGAIVVRGGKIVEVTPGAPSQRAGTVIDARGMTAVPGFLDAHKHINTGPLEKQQMAELIEAGFTTVLSGGGPGDGNIVLRDKIDKGELNGPRVLPSERINLRGTPDEARAAIRAMAAKGIRHTGEIAITPEPFPPFAELEVLRAAVDEGAKAGVQVNVHAVSTPAMVAATQAGVRRQVHLPNKDFMGFDDADAIVKPGTIVLELISFGAPVIDVFAKDNLPRFRTGLAWPETIAGANRDDKGRALGTEGAYTLINARRIWDASGGTALGYGSDQNFPVKDVLEHQLKSLMVMFSPLDVLRILGPNTAAYLNIQDEVGTLEPGKRADIVLLDGNPLADFHDFLKTKVVLKAGRVVVDKR
jgi:imidazolonepropionase-like amidohydrolase